MVGGYKVTTNISTKSALQIGVSPAPRRTPSETQRVTNLASSKIGAKRLEIHFFRETWVSFPPLEQLQEGDSFWNSYVQRIQHNTNGVDE